MTAMCYKGAWMRSIPACQRFITMHGRSWVFIVAMNHAHGGIIMRRLFTPLLFTVSLLVPFAVSAATDPDALAKQVTIRRDTFGVPHILAENEEAAAFANGYVAAEDYGPEIARLYLKARSRE